MRRQTATINYGPDSILLRWSVHPALVGVEYPIVRDFQIKRAATPGGPYSVIYTSSDNTERSYIDAVAPGSYCYVVTLRVWDFCSGQPLDGLTSNEVCLSPCAPPPCETPVISGWLFTDEGFIAGGQVGAFRQYTTPSSVIASPWSFPSSSGSLKMRMEYEDDANCVFPEFNANIQIVSAEAVLTIAPGCPARMTLNWGGMVEQENTGYERMWFYVDGNEIASAQSSAGLGGCAPMAPVSGSQEFVLQPGFHLLRLKMDTGVDGQYHFDAFYEFDISFQPE
jgi:hypothetical protein